MSLTADSFNRYEKFSFEENKLVNQKIRYELEKWQFKNIGFSAILNIITALWLTWINYGHTYQTYWLKVWCGVMIATSLVNIVLSLSYGYLNNVIFQKHRWMYLSRVAIFFASCAWCSMAFLVTPIDVSQQYFLLFVYGIVLSAFTIGEITDFISALISVCTLLLPIILWPLFKDYFPSKTFGNAALNIHTTTILGIYSVVTLFFSGLGFRFAKHYISSGFMLEYMNQALAYQASHDALTGVANRNLLYQTFESAIERAKNKNTQLAILFLDLDGFKNINDNWGHETGDKLLVCFVEILKKSIRDGDLIARLGGDEFLVLLDNVNDDAEVTEIAQRILLHLNEPVQIGENKITINSSIGVSRYPKDGTNIDVLLKQADMALYQAKANGKKRVH